MTIFTERLSSAGFNGYVTLKVGFCLISVSVIGILVFNVNDAGCEPGAVKRDFGMNDANRFVLSLGALVCAAGCATTNPSYVVIDPATSVNGGANYGADLSDCEDIAYNAYPEGSGARNATGNAVAGAAGGAALGAIVAGIFGGDVSDSAAVGAIFGGVNGAASSAGDVDYRRSQIIRRCLSKRGYSVLG